MVTLRFHFLVTALLCAMGLQAESISSTKGLRISTPSATLDLNIVSESAFCPGVCNGLLNLTVTGGEAPYTFLWNTGSTQEDLFSLCGGTYTVTVTDVLGESATATSEVIEPPTMSVSADVVDATNGQSNGSITFAVAGGTPPFRYAIEDVGVYQAFPEFTGLPAGMYMAFILDDHACETESELFEIQNVITSVSDLSARFIWYPNPASSHLFVESDVQLTVDVQDIYGNTLVNSGLASSHQILLSDLIPGLYLLKISDTNQQTYKKLIVE